MLNDLGWVQEVKGLDLLSCQFRWPVCSSGRWLAESTVARRPWWGERPPLCVDTVRRLMAVTDNSYLADQVREDYSCDWSLSGRVTGPYLLTRTCRWWIMGLDERIGGWRRGWQIKEEGQREWVDWQDKGGLREEANVTNSGLEILYLSFSITYWRTFLPACLNDF